MNTWYLILKSVGQYKQALTPASGLKCPAWCKNSASVTRRRIRQSSFHWVKFTLAQGLTWPSQVKPRGRPPAESRGNRVSPLVKSNIQLLKIRSGSSSQIHLHKGEAQKSPLVKYDRGASSHWLNMMKGMESSTAPCLWIIKQLWP